MSSCNIWIGWLYAALYIAVCGVQSNNTNTSSLVRKSQRVIYSHRVQQHVKTTPWEVQGSGTLPGACVFVVLSKCMFVVLSKSLLVVSHWFLWDQTECTTLAGLHVSGDIAHPPLGSPGFYGFTGAATGRCATLTFHCFHGDADCTMSELPQVLHYCPRDTYYMEMQGSVILPIGKSISANKIYWHRYKTSLWFPSLHSAEALMLALAVVLFSLKVAGLWLWLPPPEVLGGAVV